MKYIVNADLIFFFHLRSATIIAIYVISRSIHLMYNSIVCIQVLTINFLGMQDLCLVPEICLWLVPHADSQQGTISK